jgi:hypothetical protein
MFVSVLVCMYVFVCIGGLQDLPARGHSESAPSFTASQTLHGSGAGWSSPGDIFRLRMHCNACGQSSLRSTDAEAPGAFVDCSICGLACHLLCTGTVASFVRGIQLPDLVSLPSTEYYCSGPRKQCSPAAVDVIGTTHTMSLVTSSVTGKHTQRAYPGYVDGRFLQTGKAVFSTSSGITTSRSPTTTAMKVVEVWQRLCDETFQSKVSIRALMEEHGNLSVSCNLCWDRSCSSLFTGDMVVK